MRLSFTTPFRLLKLHEELLALPELQPVGESPNRIAVFYLEDGGDTVTVVAPDDADEQAIAAVVAAHDPTTPGVQEAAELAAAANERTIDQSLQDRLTLLRTSLDAVTANPPTLFPSLTAAERRVIRDLLRSTIELTRMMLRMFEAAD